MSLRLYDHQKEALKKMKNGCILCGDLGSGKSMTAIAYYYIQEGGIPDMDNFVPMSPSSKDPPSDLYIITTARKRDTFEWDSELSNFLLSTNPELNTYGNKIVVDSWNNIQKYTDIEHAFFIFDEQRLVGSGAWVKAFYKIAKKNKWILLTATPGDTWIDYIPVFVANGFYKNKTEFIQNHVVYSRFSNFPKVDRYVNTGKLLRLRNEILVNMHMDRKTCPHYINVDCPYDKNSYLNISINKFDYENNKPIENISMLCHRMRKVVNSDESRAKKCLEIFENHKKVIIFYNYTYELEILRETFKNVCSFAEWNGQKHEPIPKTDEWVYLVQYAAGCEGWNCIETDTIIFYSLNYSYKVMKQASGRIDRLNTPFVDLYYYKLRSKAPLDRAIEVALRNKKNFNERKFFGKG